MIRVTIEVKWNMMKCHEGRKKQSRLVWYGPGIEFYVVGDMKGGLWGQAANLAMNYAESVHIPASSLRTIKRGFGKPVPDDNLISKEGLTNKKMF